MLCWQHQQVWECLKDRAAGAGQGRAGVAGATAGELAVLPLRSSSHRGDTESCAC